MAKSIADAIQQALAPQAQAKPIAKAAKPAPPTEPIDADMPEASQPPWEFKSGSHVMEVLGSIYTQLVSMGADTLAAELYSVRAEIDYAFMLPTEASEDEPAENVYVAKHSGIHWKRNCPAPGRCFECKGTHWRENCPVAAKKSEQNSSRSLPRGDAPPARYYISKGGQVFDMSRRPLQECKRCSGKFHWFWNCPKGPSTVYIPRGASFTDKVDVKAANASGARFSKSRDTTTDGEGSTASSASRAEIVAVKRPRKVSHRSREDTPPAGAPPAAQPQPPAYPQQYPQPPWGWYPPAMWSMPPWATSPHGYPQAPPPATDPQRFSQRAAHFSEHLQQPQRQQQQQMQMPQQQTQAQAPMPPAYPQWNTAMQLQQPPPPPPPAMASHQPYAQPGDSNGAHPASY
jgi:hypothetical protein